MPLNDEVLWTPSRSKSWACSSLVLFACGKSKRRVADQYFRRGQEERDEKRGNALAVRHVLDQVCHILLSKRDSFASRAAMQRSGRCRRPVPSIPRRCSRGSSDGSTGSRSRSRGPTSSYLPIAVDFPAFSIIVVLPTAIPAIGSSDGTHLITAQLDLMLIAVSSPRVERVMRCLCKRACNFFLATKEPLDNLHSNLDCQPLANLPKTQHETHIHTPVDVLFQVVDIFGCEQVTAVRGLDHSSWRRRGTTRWGKRRDKGGGICCRYVVFRL